VLAAGKLGLAGRDHCCWAVVIWSRRARAAVLAAEKLGLAGRDHCCWVVVIWSRRARAAVLAAEKLGLAGRDHCCWVVVIWSRKPRPCFGGGRQGCCNLVAGASPTHWRGRQGCCNLVAEPLKGRKMRVLLVLAESENLINISTCNLVATRSGHLYSCRNPLYFSRGNPCYPLYFSRALYRD
jgi:hypothetical protein